MDTVFSQIILMGGREYRVPRTVTAEGGAATEQWLAAELLAGSPTESIARMTRVELEAEAIRLGLVTSLPDGVAPDEATRPFVVVPDEGKDLTNADFQRAINARRSALAALIPPSATTEPEEGDE